MEVTSPDTFLSFGIILAIAGIAGLLARAIKQPTLVGYLVAGALLGPLGFHLTEDHSILPTAATAGTTLLLFLIGLELNIGQARKMLGTALAVNGGFLVLGTLSAVGMQVLFGLSTLSTIYLAIALSFASTVVVVKTLSEGRELHALHGRLAIASLLIQDLLAIVVMVVTRSATASGASLPLLVSKLIILLTVVVFIRNKASERAVTRLAKDPELLFLGALAWCFIAILGARFLGLPAEIGAFLGGISLAGSPYTNEIVSRMRPLRDFFLLLLFVGLGSQLTLPSTQALWLTICILTVALVLKPLTSFVILNRVKQLNRTAILASLTQQPLSEFAIILFSAAVAAKQVSPDLASAVTFAVVASIILGSLTMNSRDDIVDLLRKPLHRFEPKNGFHLPEEMRNHLKEHIIIIGYHRMGYHILKKLQDLNKHLIVVDFNPDTIHRLRTQSVSCVYGDIHDPELIKNLSLGTAHLVISTIPHPEETLYLLRQAKLLPEHHRPHVIVTAHSIDDALEYYRHGAAYVILPHLLGGEYVGELITKYEHHELGRYLHHRAEEVKLLRERNHALYYD